MFPETELSSTVPAFIRKLWQMVCDPKYDDLIAWSEQGTSFMITDQLRFCSELLPMFYKHNSMSSFIRQLNKYGFRKVVSVNSASLKGDTPNFEFCHPHFIKDCPFLLDQIKRKVSISREISEYKQDQGLLARLLMEVQEMQEKQSTFESRISAMKAENDALWREHSILRQKHQKQQKIVNRLIHFLLSLVHQSRQGVNVKRRSFPLMLKDGSCLPIEGLGSLKEQRLGSTPVICEIDPKDLAHKKNSKQFKLSLNDQNISFVTPEQVENSRVKSEVQDSSNILKMSSSSKIANPAQGNIPTIVLGSTLAPKNADSPNKIITNNYVVSKRPEKRSLVLSNDKCLTKVRKIAPNIQSIDLSNLSASSSTIDSNSMSSNVIKNDKKSDILMSLSRKAYSKSPGTAAKKKLFENSKNIKYIPVKNIKIVNNDPEYKNLSEGDTTVKASNINSVDPIVDIFNTDIDYTTEDQSALLSSDPLIFSPNGTPMLSPEIVEMPDVKEDNINKSLVLSDNSNSSITKQDVESHIDLMQSDLDALKEMLHGEGLSLDASTLMGLFGSEDPLSLNMPEAGRSADNLSSSPMGNELVTYNIPNLMDINEGLDEDELTVNDPLLDDISSTLNTPLATPLTLDFPSTSKRLKK